MVDIIIPILNEAEFLARHNAYYRALAERSRLIFIDGSSDDGTVAIAQRYGDVIRSVRSRGVQKNRGAVQATSPYLLFLHADTLIDVNVLPRIESLLHDGAVGGCCTMQIIEQGWVFRFFERLVNWRARNFKIIDGDLGLFVRRDIFEKLHGYESISVMEDILFARKLKRAGEVVVLPEKIRVSGRRWSQDGFFATLFLYTKRYMMYGM